MRRRVLKLDVRVHRAAARSLSTTTLSPSMTMRSASTVDEAVEAAACVGDSHGAQTPISRLTSMPFSRHGPGGPPPASGTVDCRSRCGVRSRRFQPFLTVMYHNLVQLTRELAPLIRSYAFSNLPLTTSTTDLSPSTSHHTTTLARPLTCPPPQVYGLTRHVKRHA